MAAGERVTYESRIERIDTIAAETRALFIERPAALQFAPGQFLSFLLPVDGVTLTKPYTVASSPEDCGALEIVLNRVTGGPGSGYLFEQSVGATLRFTGPWGTFTLNEPPAAECVLIADGTAIAAIRPMLRRALATPSPYPARLHHAAPSSEHLLYRAEFEAAAQAHGRFEYDPLVSVGLEAHIEARYVAKDTDRTRCFFICGIGDIVPRLRDLLRGAGYERRAVHYEKW